VDAWLDFGEDIRVRAFRTIFGEKASDSAKAEYLPIAEKNFGLAETQFGRVNEGKGYLVGASFTVADLSIWELLDVHKFLYPTFLTKFPLLAGFYERVASRPNIASYLGSGKRHPIA